MSDRKTLYLLRRPISDPVQSLLPSASSTACSLVLLEEAVGASPAFPGPMYVLPSAAGIPATPASGKIISHRDLVELIAEHESIIVL